MKHLRDRVKQFNLWVGCVKGLYWHVHTHRHLCRTRDEHVSQMTEEQKANSMRQIREHEGMVGHSLLHVVGVYKDHEWI